MIEAKEQLIKKVVRSGNGGAVWVPKNWLGDEIIVIRPEKPRLPVKEEVIRLLVPYLRDIVAVFLYGSYARKEETADSDIDILVIARKKFNIKKIDKFDIKVIELDKLKRTIEENPIMYYSTIQEAEPIINSSLLDDLKKIEIKNKKFEWFIDTTKDFIKTNKEFIELDKLEGEYILSYSTVYSLILRLRGILLIRCIINKKEFSNKLFKQWITKYVPCQEYKKIYGAYRSVRDNKKIKEKEIKIIYAEALLKLLEDEIKKLEEETSGKQKKEAEKRN